MSKLFLILLILANLLGGNESENVCDELGLEIYEQVVSKKDAALIVERHNIYRQAIMDGVVPGEPKGRNIILLKWDDALARTAQAVANTCDFRHQVCVDRRWRYKVGQNLYRTEQPVYEPNNGNWSRAVELWFLEHKMYRYGPISTDYERTGHYTQLVWDKTKYVGCGFTAYDNDRDTMNDIAEMYVCHYGPGGNRYYRYPYQLARQGKGTKYEDTDDDYDYDYKWYRYYQSRNSTKQH